MTYSETLDYLYLKLPMFTRIGSAAIKKDVTNTILICEQLGNPHLKFKSIHIAGTNGKGSTCAMLERIYHEAGYRVACYSSPHLLRYNERIRVGCENADDEDIVLAFETVFNLADSLQAHGDGFWVQGFNILQPSSETSFRDGCLCCRFRHA